MAKRCRSCRYWKKHYGTYARTGWTGVARDDGECRQDGKALGRVGTDFCSNFREAASENNPMPVPTYRERGRALRLWRKQMATAAIGDED